jgi:arginine/lysine/ornithine decarboxylase
MRALIEGLRKYWQRGFRSFHTPGHKGRQEFFPDLDFVGFDLTELPGLDQLASASGIIAQAQQRAAEIFGAEESFFLVNGATAGNQAMFLALGEEGEGREVILSRQSHQSVMSALVLTGFAPHYLTPLLHPEFNLPLGLDLRERAIDWKSAVACHLTYPSYYGSLPDLELLIGDSARQGARCPLLIDQAHGSHYLGRLFPPSALALGADLVLHSTHKTLSALTQAAMLHVQGNNICRERLRQSLALLQSSSPSYLLMASLELAGEYALAEERWQVLAEEVENLHFQVGSSLRLLNKNDAGTYGIKTTDWSKVLLNTRSLGKSAPDCVAFLRDKHGLEPELWDQENILFLLGIGNTPEDIRALTRGLQDLAAGPKNTVLRDIQPGYGIPAREYPVLPQRLTPRQAFLARRRQVPLRESSGHIAAQTITPYPPGIPLVVMGEEITPEIVEIVLAWIQGRGPEGDNLGRGLIWVVEESR